ncbi:MAG: flotillin family protein [Planctomycetes bacterium]|nr:flotillin family protein [Planctomycetota bacterium]
MPLALQTTEVSDFVPLLIIVVGFVILAGFVLMIANRYKRCPSNKILVIYGRTGSGQSSKCLHGGGAFVWPLIQNYDFLELDPVQIEIPLQGALSLENIRVSVPSVFTVAIGTDSETMNNAAIRLLGLSTGEIMKQAEDIIFGQLRQVIASMKIEEINKDRDVFLSKVQSSLEPELSKIGLVLINVNIKDITDESGYIEAIGRKAASEAVQSAEIDVAEQEKRGAIGVANALQEKDISVANSMKQRDIGTQEAERVRAVRLAELEKEKVTGEQTARFEQEALVRDAEREMRIRVAEADATAVTGENVAKARIADANADLQEREAEAYQRSMTRRKEAEAGVLEAQYLAEARAAAANAKKMEAEKRAELEAVALARKAQRIVEAEAAAAEKRLVAEGEAAAMFARLDAEARGQYEILAKKGQGLREIIESCGGAQEAFQMLMLEHIEQISKTAAQAIANIKFDKVVVWDQGKGENGEGGAAGFLRSLAGSLPPALQMMKDIGGVEMPDYFGKLTGEQATERIAKPAAPGDKQAPPPGYGSEDGGDPKPPKRGPAPSA